MKKKQLPTNIEELQKMVLEQASELVQRNTALKEKDTALKEKDSLLKARESEIELLREQVLYFKALKFAPKSEGLSTDQLALFNDFEDSIKTTVEDKITVEPYERSKRRGKRQPLPDWLPREEIVIDLSDEEKFCPHDGTELHQIGETVSERLKIIPAKITVIKTIRIKYGCRTCSDIIKTAPAPLSLIPKSIATPSLLAWIATSKYVDGLPLHRIETTSKRFGFELKRNTMSRWMTSVAEKLAPLRKILEEELITSDYVHCDETTVQVLKEKGKKATTKSYMWLQGRAGPKPIILYNYSPSRGGAVPKKLFENFKGHLQTDGYQGYTQFKKSEDIILMGCMAHMRRKFYDSWVATKRKKSGAAYITLQKIKKIYKIEEEIKDKSFDEKLIIRQGKSVNLMENLFSDISNLKEKYPAESLLGKAITYAINQEDQLKVFLSDGKLSIDNNFIERAVRPFAVGRNAWKFSASTNGADASALWYSLIETAKMNNVEPFAYLERILTKLPHAETLDDYLELLPFNLD